MVSYANTFNIQNVFLKRDKNKLCVDESQSWQIFKFTTPEIVKMNTRVVITISYRPVDFSINFINIFVIVGKYGHIYMCITILNVIFQQTMFGLIRIIFFKSTSFIIFIGVKDMAKHYKLQFYL